MPFFLAVFFMFHGFLLTLHIVRRGEILWINGAFAWSQSTKSPNFINEHVTVLFTPLWYAK